MQITHNNYDIQSTVRWAQNGDFVKNGKIIALTEKLSRIKGRLNEFIKY